MNGVLNDFSEIRIEKDSRRKKGANWLLDIYSTGLTGPSYVTLHHSPAPFVIEVT